jgi:hypothetical protein
MNLPGLSIHPTDHSTVQALTFIHFRAMNAIILQILQIFSKKSELSYQLLKKTIVKLSSPIRLLIIQLRHPLSKAVG